MPSFLHNPQVRGYIGSAVILFMIVALLSFLAFYEIPTANNEIFKVIVGMFVGSLSSVIFTLIGKDTEEVSILKAEKEKLVEQNEQLKTRVSHLESMFMQLQSEVITKLSLLADFKTNRNA